MLDRSKEKARQQPQRSQVVGRRVTLALLHLCVFLVLTFKPVFLDGWIAEVAFITPFAQSVLMLLLGLESNLRLELRFLLPVAGVFLSWYSLSSFMIWGIGGTQSAHAAIFLSSLSFGIVLCYAAVHLIEIRFQSAKPSDSAGMTEPHSSFGIKSLILWTLVFALLFWFIQYGVGVWKWDSQRIDFAFVMKDVVYSLPFIIATISILLAFWLFRNRQLTFAFVILGTGLAGGIPMANLFLSAISSPEMIALGPEYVMVLAFALLVGATFTLWSPTHVFRMPLPNTLPSAH